MIGHVVPPALGYLEGDERRDDVSDPCQIHLGTESGDHALCDELVEPRLDGVAGDLEMTGQLYRPGSRAALSAFSNRRSIWSKVACD